MIRIALEWISLIALLCAMSTCNQCTQETTDEIVSSIESE